MLTSEHIDSRGAGQGHEPGTDEPPTGTRRTTPRSLRITVAVLGLLGALLAVAVPLLPVTQHTATVTWPDAGDVSPVSLPLVAYEPQEMTATVPCATAVALDTRRVGGAVLFSTTPISSLEGSQVGMQLRIEDGNLLAITRGEALASEPLPPGPCDIVLRSTVEATTITVGGSELGRLDEDRRPQVVGLYTHLLSELDPVDGMAVRIVADTRYDTSPHPAKSVAIALAVLCVLGSLVLLHRIDVRVGRRAPRFVPKGWWRPTWRDGTVVLVLAVWVLIGGITSDDGYILTMAQDRAANGYIGNYYRWFNVPEAPFGWFYEVYALWAQVSASPPWLRIPSALMGVISWLLISREVLPRLGREVRRSTAAGWAAAAVFLAFWMPYNNGLRPEPVVAIGSLVVLCAVERALVIRRVTPLAAALLVAAFTVAATPTGLIAVAPFLVAARPLLRLVRKHAAASGWAAVLGPVLGTGLLVLVAIFADQTFQAVVEATRVRTAIGPSLSWFEELVRYQDLLSPTPNGSLARRFPVLLLLLCVGTCLVVLLRRGAIPGVALDPSRRLIAMAAMSLALIALTPTKWTHHFGAFASIGAAMGALTALATSSTVLRSRRNRAAFTAGLLLVAAFAATGPNAPWYVSQFGVPWFDKPPQLRGFLLSNVLLGAAAVAAAVAVVENLRAARPGAATPPPLSGTASAGRERRRRALRLSAAPLVVVCGLLVTAEFAAAAKGMLKQRDSYSLGAANVEGLFGSSCNLSDAVLVEQEPLDGVLPRAEQPGLLSADGFEADAVPGPGNPAGFGDDGPLQATQPYGFGGADAPIWGSYLPEGPGTGELTTPWSALPDSATSGDAPLVISLAGTLGDTTPVFAEFSQAGSPEVVATLPLINPAEAPDLRWRDIRLSLAGTAASTADRVRLVATDNDLTRTGWVAVTAPRVPQWAPLTEVVGRETPVFFDWPVGFVHPCLRPSEISGGIAEVPAYRLAPDQGDGLLQQSKSWSAPIAGGSFGWMQIMADTEELPTYLEGDWTQDWGALLRVEPLGEPADDATVVRTDEGHSGWWTPGPMRTVRPSLSTAEDP